MWKLCLYYPWNTTMDLCTSRAAFWLPVYFRSGPPEPVDAGPTTVRCQVSPAISCVWHHCVSPSGSMMRVLSAPWVACAKYSVNMGVRRSLCWLSLKGDFWCSVTLNAALAPLSLMQPNCNLTTIRLQQLIFAHFKKLKDDSFHCDTDSIHSEFRTIYRPFCNEKTMQ